jgi:hypothetical protein
VTPILKKKVAISQSNYIPWKGYFDNIACVDEFVLYDDMQYTKRDWRNRNKIKTANGLLWLSIPVEVSGKYFQKINETKVSDKKWAKNHWESIRHNYSKAAQFKEMKDFVGELYAKVAKMDYLTEINHYTLQTICNFLGITTKITLSSDYNLLPEGKTERLVDLCKQLGASAYYSGAAAKDYMDESLFTSESISVNYYDYSGYQEYSQLYPPFEHGVSIIDLILNEGTAAKNFLKYTQKDETRTR